MVERLAVYTTIYPGVEQYLATWYRSVELQTDRAFDLWLGVDRLSREAVIAALGAEPRAEWVMSQPGQNGGGVRAAAIARMADSYDAVVFVDSDDLLDPTRVAAARSALGRCDLAACALRIVDQVGREMGPVFGLPEKWALEQILTHYNVLGLSNTAYRTAVLRRCLPVPEDCVLLDWLLGTRAWAFGATIEFDRTPHMAYRQYPANMVRVIPPFGPDYVLTATKRVLAHYDCVLDARWPLPEPAYSAVVTARGRARGFHRALSGSRVRLERYVVALNRLPPIYVWWWCVAHPELEGIWRD